MRIPRTTWALVAAAVFGLAAGCSDLAGVDEGDGHGAAGAAFKAAPRLTTNLYLPHMHAYSDFAPLVTVTDEQGRLVSGAQSPHMKFHKEGSTSMTEVAFHEIGKTGVYAPGDAGKRWTHKMNITNIAEHDFAFHFKHAGHAYEKEVHGKDVAANHGEAETGGTEYRIEYWLEKADGTKTQSGHAHEGDTRTIVFLILNHDTKAPITNLAPRIYAAPRGGPDASAVGSTGTLTGALTGDAAGRYTYDYTFAEHGDFDITLDLDGNQATHGDRFSFTQTVSHGH